MIGPQVPQAISLGALRRVLSEPRLEAYRLAPTESPDAVIGRYRWNIALSMSLYPVVQQLEVALRNNLHRAIAERYRTDEWYDATPALLTPREQEAVTEAKDELRKQGKPQEPNRLVAELTLGFWTSLLSRDYERRFWPHLLAPAFPFIPRPQRTRATVAGRLHQIRQLRNRISHHEPIFKLNLPRLYGEIEETIRWMAPALLQLLPVGEQFRDIHARGPAAYALPLS